LQIPPIRTIDLPILNSDGDFFPARVGSHIASATFLAFDVDLCNAGCARSIRARYFSWASARRSAQSEQNQNFVSLRESVFAAKRH